MSTINVSNLVGPSSTGTAAVLSSINGGPLAGFRNRIINGNFDIWQSGTSFTGNEYGADQWANFRIGTTTTATRQAFTIGQTDVPGEPEFFHRSTVSSVAGAGNYSLLAQRIENVRTFAGQQVTISFWAKADATRSIAIELLQFYGTGGTPSAETNGIGTTKISIGTSWQKITATANMPSISGKTLGTNNDHFVALQIFFDAGSNLNSRTNSLGQQSGTFDIAQVQIEPGTVATPFERRPIGTELALCQRYYEVGSLKAYVGGATLASITLAQSFKVTKRAAPTMAYSTGAFRSFLPTSTEWAEAESFGVLRASANEIACNFTASARL